MSEVTEGDREKAAELLRGAYRQEAIAGALAEEREKARAPFLALAETFSAKAERARNGQNQWGKDTFDHGEAYAFRQAAGDVLEAAEEG